MIVKYTTKEKELLARLMRAEAVGEGDLGMLMVGNVGINRVLADCLTFKDIRTTGTKVNDVARFKFTGAHNLNVFENLVAVDSYILALSVL